MRIIFKQALSNEELDLNKIILGPQPRTKPTANYFSILYKDGKPFKRFNLYDQDYYDFNKLYYILNGWIVICFGNHIHWFNLKSHNIISYNLKNIFSHFWYFSEIHEYKNNILIATDEYLCKFDNNSNLIWVSESIAIDGININKIDNNIIECSCEMDPPGGWIEKSINLNTGKIK
jgi:hypothetical protein